MAKWNKKIGLAVSTLGLLAFTPSIASANDCYSCDPCGSPCSFGGFEVGVDFIYWKPCFDAVDYACTYSNTPSSTSATDFDYECIDLDWEPGFRVKVGKRSVWGEWDLSASYTWIKSKDSSSVSAPAGGFVSTPWLHEGLVDGNATTYANAFGDWDTSYQTWDVLFSYNIDCNRCHSFRPFFGVEGLILNQSFESQVYNDTVDGTNSYDIDWTSDFFGVGLKLGSDYTYQLFDCVKLFASASGTLLVGDYDTTNTHTRITTTTGTWEFSDCDNTHLVPGYHLAVGLQYDTNMCGIDYGIRLGWEFVEWCNISNPRTFAGSDQASDYAIGTDPDTRTIGFHGLLAGLDIRF